MNLCQFLHQLYTSSQLMGSPALRVREFVRMERVIIRSCVFFPFPHFRMTGLGIIGLRSPILLMDGTCLNFLVSIIVAIMNYVFAKIGVFTDSSKYLFKNLCIFDK